MNAPFRFVESNPGDILVDGLLDRETQSEYTLYVNTANKYC